MTPVYRMGVLAGVTTSGWTAAEPCKDGCLSNSAGKSGGRAGAAALMGMPMVNTSAGMWQALTVMYTSFTATDNGIESSLAYGDANGGYYEYR